MAGSVFLIGFILLSCANQNKNIQTSAMNTKDAATKNTEQTATPTQDGLELATLGGGCFWCVEAIYQELEGVHKVVSGYAGGPKQETNYKAVCSGTTGHAEVVQITFDPKVISFAEILDVFWRVHDPTTLNRQGADVGTQYRSVIFYHSETQKATAERLLKETDESSLWANPIVTEISPISNYSEAEKYHQDYYNLNPNQSYCTYVIAPKVNKFKKEFKDKLKK